MEYTHQVSAAPIWDAKDLRIDDLKKNLDIHKD